MSRHFSLTPVFTVLLTALVTAGLGLYLAPRFGELLSLTPINWDIRTQQNPQQISLFTEGTMLQNQYETALKQDIVTTLEKITGTDTVHTVVRAPLDLIRETGYKSFNTQTDTVKSAVNRLSVTVLIDGNALPNLNGKTVYQPRSRQDIRKYTDIVKSVVGFNARRGDKVTVQNMPFMPSKGSIGGIPRIVWANGIAFLLFAGLIIGIMIFCLFPMMRLTIRRMGEKPSSHGFPLLKRVRQICHKHPDQSLSVIKGWLNAPQIRKNSRTYTPAERVGIFVLALGKAETNRLLAPLPPSEKQALACIISRLGRFSASDIQDVLIRFMRDFYAPDYLKGSPQEAQEIFPSFKNPSFKAEQWADICALSDEDMKTLLHHTDKDVLISALSDADTDMRMKFAHRLPPLIWQEFRNRWTASGRWDSRQARHIIIKTAQELNLIG